MENTILNKKPLYVFVIIAETVEGWKNIASDEGHEVLQKHYAWLTELKNNGKLLLSGPTDFELTSTNKINAIGHTTGVIMLTVNAREEAEKCAYEDPFHSNGFRINRVYSMKITATNDLIFNNLEKVVKV